MVILKSAVSAFECAMNRIERPNFCAMTVVSYDELGGLRILLCFFHSSSSLSSSDGGYSFGQVF